MNLALQFHDSEVGRIAGGDGTLTVSFSAASVRPPAVRPGAVGGIGQVLNLQMRLDGVTGPAPSGDCIGRLSGGTVSVDGKLVSPLHLPSAHRGAVLVTLAFTNGSVLDARAQSVEFGFAGEPRFVESYAC